jgi:predicted TIM-barrel fold metal-dependent hydrolase
LFVLRSVETLRYEWLKGPNQIGRHIVGDIDSIRRSYPLSELQSDALPTRVTKWVHVQAECASALGEVEMVQAVADRLDGVASGSQSRSTALGIVAHANFAAGASGGVPSAADDKQFESALDAIARHRSVRGVRQLLNWVCTLRFTADC